MSFEEIKDGSPEAMQAVLATQCGWDLLIAGEDHAETYHLSQRSFQINRRLHTWCF